MTELRRARIGALWVRWCWVPLALVACAGESTGGGSGGAGGGGSGSAGGTSGAGGTTSGGTGGIAGGSSGAGGTGGTGFMCCLANATCAVDELETPTGTTAPTCPAVTK